MGGFYAFTREDEDAAKSTQSHGTPYHPLHSGFIKDKIRAGKIELPLEEEIQDRSKTDWLAKTLVLLQTGWFFVQCIARRAAHLPLSELEVITLAYTIMSVGTYIAWWNKPRNVDRPIRVFMSNEEIERTKPEESEPINSWTAAYSRVVYSLLPGFQLDRVRALEYEDILDIMTTRSVSMFETGGTRNHKELWWIALVSSAVGSAFGAIHCTGWSYSFPSHAERLLWRLSSITMISIPILIILPYARLLTIYGDPRLYRPPASIVWRAWNFIQPFFFFSIILLCLPLYVGARIVTFVIAFRSLTSLSPDIFYTIPWTKWIPHI
jgi:hypothetical protein